MTFTQNYLHPPMPLWKLQTLRRQKIIFLYEENLVDGQIALLHGVAYCLRQFNSFIMQIARTAWVCHIRSNPLNRALVGDDSDLESFLFAADRAPLRLVRELLTDIQSKKCFYCNKHIRGTTAVDHFIPWSRYPRDIIQNFVLADQRCNLDKSDLLAAAYHLEKWRERNTIHELLLSEFRGASIISDGEAILSVARWTYGHAFSSNSQVWLGYKRTEALTSQYLSILC